MFDADLPVDVHKLAAIIITTAVDQLQIHRQTHEQSKDANDLVTDIDLAIEQQLRSELLDLLPGSGFVGEESTPATTSPSTIYSWVVDPIDGTINFARGYEFYTSVVCCQDKSGPLIALIYQPAQDIITIAVRGKGCRQWPHASASIANLGIGRVLHVGNHVWGQSVHSIMLTPKLAPSARQRSFELIDALLNETLGMRVLVSQAYESLKLAEGGVSSVISLQSSGGWSRDAARLICESAGGTYMTIQNRDQPNIHGFILAATPEIFDIFIAKLDVIGYSPAD